jgi:hypothetical protein
MAGWHPTFYRGPCGTKLGKKVCGHKKRMHTIFGGPCRFKPCPAKCQVFSKP